MENEAEAGKDERPERISVVQPGPAVQPAQHGAARNNRADQLGQLPATPNAAQLGQLFSAGCELPPASPAPAHHGQRLCYSQPIDSASPEPSRYSFPRSSSNNSCDARPSKRPVDQDGDEYALNRWVKRPYAFLQSLTQTWQGTVQTPERNNNPDGLISRQELGPTDGQIIPSSSVTKSSKSHRDTVKPPVETHKKDPVNSNTDNEVLLFACPFFQRSKLTYCQTGSCTRGYTSLQRLKEHLKRYHYSGQQCARCWKKFKTLKDYEEHVKVPDTDYACGTKLQRPEGMDDAQQSKIARYSRIVDTDKEKWQKMFQILFPEEEVLSPYWGDPGLSSSQRSAVNNISHQKTQLDKAAEDAFSDFMLGTGLTPEFSDPNPLELQMGLQPLPSTRDESFGMQHSVDPGLVSSYTSERQAVTADFSPLEPTEHGSNELWDLGSSFSK